MAHDLNRPHVDIMRSPLGRARGLGAAHSGASHWWGQNLSSIALAPLSLWFVCSMIRLEGANRADVAAWLHRPAVIVLTLALILAVFYHMQLGVQVVIEDYVPKPSTRLAALLILKAAAFLLALACIAAALRLWF